jgi:hypothetical protein
VASVSGAGCRPALARVRREWPRRCLGYRRGVLDAASNCPCRLEALRPGRPRFLTPTECRHLRRRGVHSGPTGPCGDGMATVLLVMCDNVTGEVCVARHRGPPGRSDVGRRPPPAHSDDRTSSRPACSPSRNGTWSRRLGPRPRCHAPRCERAHTHAPQPVATLLLRSTRADCCTVAVTAVLRQCSSDDQRQ